MVEENNSVGIVAVVNAATDINYRYTKQQIDFNVYTKNYFIPKPAQSLRATIMQNGRWDNAITGLTYRTVKPGELGFYFDNLNKNVINGGAEFRVFDIRTLRSLSDRIVSVNFEDRINQVYVLEDVARPFGAYETKTTLKGGCIWLNYDFNGRNTEDYVLVHFALRCNFQVSDGDLYVFGELTDWQITPEAKLFYSSETSYWETALFLKQGYYNYQYVFVPHKSVKIDETFIEGSHWQTDNDYTILIYLQDEGTSYDKLIGTTVTSIKR